MLNYQYDLDVTPGSVPLYIHASQYDGESRTFEFRLFSSAGVLALPDGCTAAVKGTKPDGNGFSYDAELNGTNVTVILTKQMTAVAGQVKCEIVLSLGETELGTANFILSVERAALDKDTLISGSEIRELVEVIDRTDEIIAAAKLADESQKNIKTYSAEAKTAAKNAADSASDASDTLIQVEKRASEIAQIKTEADTIASQALEKASNAENEVAESQNTLDSLKENDDSMRLLLEGKVDGAFVENGYLYLTSNNEVVAGPLGPFSGTGGSGTSGGNNAEITVSNTSGWLSKTIAENNACPVGLTWSSAEDGMATGNGTMKLTVNGIVKAVLDVAQGAVTVDVSKYLTTGNNIVKVNVADVYGNNRTINYSVTVIAISISSSFDATSAYTGVILFPYVPVGSVSKTIHFIMDGKEIGTATTSVSGRQQSFTIPQQKHGAHVFQCYFDSEVNGQTVRSNELYYEIICLEVLNDTPVIVSDFHESEVTQYTSLHIAYTVYAPASLTADVTILINGKQVSVQTVDRTQQTFSYRADEVGELNVSIQSGDTTKEISLTVLESGIEIEAETEALSLYLSSYGRSNNEEDRSTWTYNEIAAKLTDFNYASDGWKADEDGNTVLRVSGDARVTIPYQIFGTDFRSTGKTIELEFATRDVMDYDAVILSCLSGDRGLTVTAQKALLKSEQSKISMQFKEEEHVRVAFVVEKRSENRLVYCYINGIMSGVVQYPTDDDFAQVSPVGISIGSNDCTVDLYCIRVYDNDLTRHQILNNWIADTQDAALMLERYQRNSVYDDYGNVVIAQLPGDLPYLLIECEELPQYKGDKKTISGSYVDPVASSKSFTFEGAQADVQGTSSQYYARKNYKIKFKGGFLMSGGSQKDGYSLRSDSIPTSTFTFKADVASSEGANNVELVRLYNDACPFQTPAQKENASIRQGIDGIPVVVFWSDGTNTTFLGKYNFNNDKGTPEVYGFSDGDESWEILNNTSDRVLWKSADFSTEGWLNDFEARYPEDNTDSTNLAALAAWLVSTDQSQATGAALASAVTYDGTSYTNDTAAYRLAKFKNELSLHMEKQAVLFYYLFTELFLMVDSRAKNMFPTFIGGSKWFSLPYDFDTALGINNEGALVFDYNLEDIDQTEGGADVFNGQNSVLWVNLRQAFYDDLKSMYQELRSTGVLSYDKVEAMFEEHQAKWPEAVFNEDAWFKYLQPLVDDGSGAYLPMLQGSKAEQRKWWLYNRFRYLDSKYNAGDALSDVITVRGYAKGDITVRPYAAVYASVKYGSYLVQKRAFRGSETLLECPLDNVNDTEIYIYSASQLASVGDLSPLMVGYADFSYATKLQALKLGDAASTYSNGNLTELQLGNNVLLQTLDVRNCPNLTQPVDLSGCSNLEEVYFDGTGITGLTLPNGGILKTLHLPGTVTNLTLRNQTLLKEFSLPDYSNISTLRLENNSSAIDTRAILETIPAGSRVRLIGVDWSADSVDEINAIFDVLDTMRGLDENGANTDQAQVSGTIYITEITGAELLALNARYANIRITYDHVTSQIFYCTYDGSELLHTETVKDNGSGTYDGTPSRESTAEYYYTFAGWSTKQDSQTADAKAVTDVSADRTVYAAYTRTVQRYSVYFYNGTTRLQVVTGVAYGSSATYTGETPVSSEGSAEDYPFEGWSPEPKAITGTTRCYAQFGSPRVVKEITDSWEGIIAACADGTYKSKYSAGNYKTLDLGTMGTVTMEIVGINKDELADGTGKAPLSFLTKEALSLGRLNPVLVTNCDYPQLPSWKEGDGGYWNARNTFVVDTANGTWKITAETAGTLTITYGTTLIAGSNNGICAMTVIVNGETLADKTTMAATDYTVECSAGDVVEVTAAYETQKETQFGAYVRFKSTGTISVAAEISNCKVRVVTNYDDLTGSIGGWENCELRSKLSDTVLPLVPDVVRNAVKPVTKSQTSFDTAGNSSSQTTEDTLWIPDYDEVFTVAGAYHAGFPDDESRIKYDGSNAVSWRLREAASAGSTFVVSTSGKRDWGEAGTAFKSAFGFCL